MEVLDKGRVEVAATSLGIARAAMESALGWVKNAKLVKTLSCIPRNSMAYCGYAHAIGGGSYVDLASCGIT